MVFSKQLDKAKEVDSFSVELNVKSRPSNRGGSEMQDSTARVEREISAHGIEFDKGSLDDRLCQVTDLRKAKGKQYSLKTLLRIILMAKLCGDSRLGKAWSG